MSVVRFIADLHLGHENMAIKRGFTNSAEHDAHVIKKFNSVVNKRDVTYILGDVTMEKPNYDILDQLNGSKYVVLGNHDKKQHVTELLKHVSGVAGMIHYKGVFLTHCPIHPTELEYRVPYNIHGHIHENQIMTTIWVEDIIMEVPDSRYICVSCERVDYTPKTLKELCPSLIESI